MVDREVSLATIRKEIAECKNETYGWSFSEIDETNLSFQVEMKAKDGELYIIKINFDNYRLWPLLIDFIDPATGKVGVKTAYPSCTDSFFHKSKIAICHPCSRKAYAGYAAIHKEWGELVNWQSNQHLGMLKSLRPILAAIYSRITGDLYNGRMEKRTEN